MVHSLAVHRDAWMRSKTPQDFLSLRRNWCSIDRFGPLLALGPLALAEPDIERWQHQEREQRCAYETADHQGRALLHRVPVASAIGTKPSEATSAVIATGRKRVIAPSRIARRGA